MIGGGLLGGFGRAIPVGGDAEAALATGVETLRAGITGRGFGRGILPVVWEGTAWVAAPGDKPAWGCAGAAVSRVGG